VGRGRIVWGKPLEEVLASVASPADFQSSTPLRFTHRRSGATDLYFVANPKAEPVTTAAAFRVGAKAPEFWWPESGRIERPAVYDVGEGVVRLPITLGPHGSVFVVFRDHAAAASERIVSVTREGREILGTRVAELVSATPRPDRAAGGPPVEVVRRGSELVALLGEPGDYELVFADGQRRRVSVADLPAPQVVEGPWQVQFAPGGGAPERVIFDALADWTQRPEHGIRHYSGKAVYRKTIEIPASWTTEGGSRLFLDLGEVRDLAIVSVNGKELGTLWLAPWRLDITGAVRPGANALEIEVVNVWNNRLVGDAPLPAAQRQTFLLAPTVHANSPLLPAGLLGPVRLTVSAVR
jgi:hypothetical protein